MPLYRIPIYFRRTATTGGLQKFAAKRTLKCVDGVGFYVDHLEEEDLSDEAMRRYLMGRQRHTYLIEAASREELLDRFYTECEGARTGGETPESKAVWIDPDELIVELPACDRLNRSRQGQYACGPITPESDEEGELGEFGGCILSDFDGPDDCPIADFYSRLYQWQLRGCLPNRKIGDFDFISEEDLPQPA